MKKVCACRHTDALKKSARCRNGEGTDTRLLAAHLAYHLGAVKTGSDWTTRAWRKDKKHPRALFYHAIDALICTN